MLIIEIEDHLLYSCVKFLDRNENGDYVEIFNCYIASDALSILEEEEDFIEINQQGIDENRTELTSAIIKKYILRKHYSKKLSSIDSCCVCLNKFKIKQKVSQIKKCKHVFCISCLNTWLKYKSIKQCPLCRINIVA
ncbi:hypothetical protein [Orgyia leucostigma nucleopolyhedrovirus]|uniref:RING-type domain-containing protein n=1 Tax=Orgyia leucostigma nucleopolyhedrovirus TaxID=490711 RepID=B0FDU7_9ABAC|nr:hypothetical protein [Orgyia leucostigma nucleopolyhedrovirus]ABY65805.1 hypothetical protein [Orgyia leucostigma nucleopolyhedrovirus]